MSTTAAPTTITPTKYRACRKLQRAEHARLREVLRRIRRLRATGRILDAEEADGELAMFWHYREIYRQRQKALASVAVVKNSHLSPAAAARATEAT